MKPISGVKIESRMNAHAAPIAVLIAFQTGRMIALYSHENTGPSTLRTTHTMPWKTVTIAAMTAVRNIKMPFHTGWMMLTHSQFMTLPIPWMTPWMNGNADVWNQVTKLLIAPCIQPHTGWTIFSHNHVNTAPTAAIAIWNHGTRTVWNHVTTADAANLIPSQAAFTASLNQPILLYATTTAATSAAIATPIRTIGLASMTALNSHITPVQIWIAVVIAFTASRNPPIATAITVTTAATTLIMPENCDNHETTWMTTPITLAMIPTRTPSTGAAPSITALTMLPIAGISGVTAWKSASISGARFSTATASTPPRLAAIAPARDAM